MLVRLPRAFILAFCMGLLFSCKPTTSQPSSVASADEPSKASTPSPASCLERVTGETEFGMLTLVEGEQLAIVAQEDTVTAALPREAVCKRLMAYDLVSGERKWIVEIDVSEDPYLYFSSAGLLHASAPSRRDDRHDCTIRRSSDGELVYSREVIEKNYPELSLFKNMSCDRVVSHDARYVYFGTSDGYFYRYDTQDKRATKLAEPRRVSLGSQYRCEPRFGSRTHTGFNLGPKTRVWFTGKVRGKVAIARSKPGGPGINRLYKLKPADFKAKSFPPGFEKSYDVTISEEEFLDPVVLNFRSDCGPSSPEGFYWLVLHKPNLEREAPARLTRLARDGSSQWTYEFEFRPYVINGKHKRGTYRVVDNGFVLAYPHEQGAILLRLDLDTGKIVWKKRLGEP